MGEKLHPRHDPACNAVYDSENECNCGLHADFELWGDGEWHEPCHDGYLAQCCDCGLVHRIDFKVRETDDEDETDEPYQVQMRWSRADRSEDG